MTAKTVEKKINTVWKEVCHRRNISLRVKHSYVSSNTDLPQLYYLTKTHKLQQGIRIRPNVIVSNISSPTMRLLKRPRHLSLATPIMTM